MIDYTRKLPGVSLLRLLLGWTLLLSLLLTVANDFSWQTAPARLLYWGVHIGLGLAAVTVVTRWLQQRGLSSLSQAGQLMASCIVAVLVFTPIAVLLELVLPIQFGPDGHGDLLPEASDEGIGRAILSEVISAGPIVVAIWLIVHLSYRFLNPISGATETQIAPADGDIGALPSTSSEVSPEPEPGADAPATDLLSRLPPALGSDVVLIRSDANYVHVTTTRGKTMLLYGLNRAADELGDCGLLVHRSFWVGRDHVQAVRKQGSQTVCVMVDGTIVPVSRRRQKSVVDLFGRNFNRVTES